MKFVSFVFIFFSFLHAETLQVHLTTASHTKGVYISRIHTDPSEWDWRYFDELRTTLESDLDHSGKAHIPPTQLEFEELFHWTNIAEGFEIAPWKKTNCSFVLALSCYKKKLSLAAFNLENESVKQYPDFILTGNLEKDRSKIHQLADLVHKDLFGISGIASLKILYAQRAKNLSDQGLGFLSEIWSCNTDGSDAQQLTFQNGYCLSPGCFPEGKGDSEFYYVFNNEGQSKIYKSSFAKLEGAPFISLRGNQALPSISSQGNMMAFITDAAGRPDLFIQSLDSRRVPIGKPRQIFSSPKATQASPCFSPDGKQIAFVSDKDGPPRIYVMPVPNAKETKKTKPELITVKNKENTSPTWSPDGKKLAYSAKTDGVRQIWIYDFETKEEKQLTFGPEMKENPAWAPNSFHLVYNTESNESSELYLMHLNQITPTLISKGPGQKRFPCWTYSKG